MVTSINGAGEKKNNVTVYRCLSQRSQRPSCFLPGNFFISSPWLFGEISYYFVFAYHLVCYGGTISFISHQQL